MRLTYISCCCPSFGFNPRICKRCDDGEGINVDFTHVSIHASVKDATISHSLRYLACGVSIHASVKDATLAVLYGNLLGSVSIHASVKDATQGLFTGLGINKFQSTHL